MLGKASGGRGFGVVHCCLSQERNDRHHPKGRTKGLTGSWSRRVRSGYPLKQSAHRPSQEVTTPKRSAAQNTRKGTERASGPATCRSTDTHGTHFLCDPANAHTPTAPTEPLGPVHQQKHRTPSLTNETPSAGHQETRGQSESAGPKTTHKCILGGCTKKRVRTLDIRR